MASRPEGGGLLASLLRRSALRPPAARCGPPNAEPPVAVAGGGLAGHGAGLARDSRGTRAGLPGVLAKISGLRALCSLSPGGCRAPAIALPPPHSQARSCKPLTALPWRLQPGCHPRAYSPSARLTRPTAAPRRGSLRRSPPTPAQAKAERLSLAVGSARSVQHCERGGAGRPRVRQGRCPERSGRQALQHARGCPLARPSPENLHRSGAAQGAQVAAAHEARPTRPLRGQALQANLPHRARCPERPSSSPRRRPA